MEKVLITGGTGLIGQQLSKVLNDKGYEVRLLSRNPSNASKYKTYRWSIEKEYIDTDALKNIDYIVHLAGANLGEKLWSEKRKQVLRDSRINGSELLLKKIIEKEIQIKAFISASAVGIYPAYSEGGPIFIENDIYGSTFIAELCKDWEKAADNFANNGIRTVKIRTSLVQDLNDPALKKILQVSKFGILPVFGKGLQPYPWIHIKDLCNIYIEAIDNDNFSGPINAVAPEQINNLEYTKTIKKVKKKGFIVKIPKFAFKILFGEMSDIILRGTKINSILHNNSNFKFEYPSLKSTMEDILN
jgi:uncharacterized protein (TIGR01777 family)